jgi:hypothetical protein
VSSQTARRRVINNRQSSLRMGGRRFGAASASACQQENAAQVLNTSVTQYLS